MINLFRKRLFWKFFFSYFVMILLSMMVLFVIIRILLPGVFNSHLVSMADLFSRHGMEHGVQSTGGRGRMMMTGSVFYMDLFRIFNQIIFESILLSVLPSIVIALGVSAMVSQQFVRPLRQMTLAADRIADGNYQERLPMDATSPEALDELGQLAVRFNRMTTRLEQIEDIRQKLIGDVAHELRTPLTVIKGAMEGLMDGVLVPDVASYEMIYRQADRLERLVQDLQELNHIEMGILDLNLIPVNINTFLENIIQTMQINFSKKGVKLDLQLPEKSLDVMADEDRLEQILINLLSNALCFTPKGEKVWVSADVDSGNVKISVRDSGIGIPKDHLPFVFSRFYRVDGSRSRQAGGSGIGLTIVKKLVEAQGGKVFAESDGPGEGSVFLFTLPQA
jgi:two-component system, OmpR family, sensor histidine kinase BaeS